MSGSSLKVQHIGNTFGFAASSLAFELVDELQHIDVNKIYQELSCKDGSLASFPKGENDVSQAKYNLGRNESTLNSDSMYQAASYTIRSYLLDKMNKTKKKYREQSVKRCYYLSMEFLMGRAMQNAIVNIDCEESFRKALLDLGYELEDLYELECDAGLGNGGLGRLAACFLDSFSTLNLPVWGYGIRFQYGIFQQKIENGWQKEYPDYWLQRGWVEGKMVKAIAYDNPIPGYKTDTCNNLRLWRCVPLNEFDFDAFNNADYFGAKKEKEEAEAISSVLYPNDNDYQGKLLRLKQEYFFVSASLQDALRRFKKNFGTDWNKLPSKVVFQLNDTHPAIAPIELMRLLIDSEDLSWEQTKSLFSKCFAYTNHTVLPEALENWDINLFKELLPRHLEIINQLNHEMLEEIKLQISTAGMEASGTGNMKFVMNGSLIVGTMDGATVEIVEQCGEDTAFIFGAFEHEVANIRQNQTNGLYNIDFRLKRVFDWINEGHLGQNDEETNKRLNDFVNSHYRRNGTRCADYFLLSNDFGSYIDAQSKVDETYKDEAKWWEKSINAATSMGFFSTDRTIKDYSELIWQVEPCL
ncbi:glycogen phosphorylase 1-like [Dermatophagoides farinae]|uniref:glycogen phosphorylase 1-like n=1 Tax=Dermatophagoides farinae TaxID=6954 RepID=UPI003F63E939